ncbi:hypothetical protein J4217_00545 [Candidatus Pacearchaeota archaeon]|nr:hypothetical protein [Candidatus Pacearchaeota archaeon]
MFLGKEVRVLLKGQALESFLELKKRTDRESLQLIRSIERMITILKENPQYGDPVKKDLIPEELKKEGINNLYRAELSNYWRMLYTLEGNRIEIFVFILTITDHPKYDKMFGYKKR